MSDNKDLNNVNLLATNSADTRVMVRPEEEESIDIADVFYLLLDHIVEIILAFILGGLLAFCFTYFFITPKYTSTSKIYIISASNDSIVDLSDLQIGTQLTDDYKKLILIHPLIEQVNDNLGLNMTYGQIVGMINITNPDKTRLLYISVTSPDPQQAADIANEVARLSFNYLPEIMGCKAPNIAEWARPAAGASSPSYVKNTALGSCGAAALLCAFFLIRMLTNDTFGSQEDIEKYLGDTPIGIIPEGNMGNESNGRKLKKLNKSQGGKKE